MAIATWLTGEGQTSATRWSAIRARPPGQIASVEWRALIDRLSSGLGDVERSDDVVVHDALSSARQRPLSERVVPGLFARATTLTNMCRWKVGSPWFPFLTVVHAALVDDGLVPGSPETTETSTGLPGALEELAAEDQLAATSAHRMLPIHRGLLEVVAEAGGWWPTPLGVILADRPTVIHETGLGFHNDTGPAIEYADGWSIWALNGGSVTRQTVMAPQTLTVATIQAATDPRRRAAMVTRYGASRYIADMAVSPDLVASEPSIEMAQRALAVMGEERFVRERGVVIDSDLDLLGQPRRLWRAERPRDDAIVMVEVVNSTPEPDGSRRHYFLRVRPNHGTCKQAVAWTFGLTDTQYQLVQET